MNTDTPETDGEWNRLACQDHPEFERNLADFARKLERERDELNHQLARSQAAGTIWYRRCFGEDAEWQLGELTKLRSALIRINDAVVARLRAGSGGDERLELLRASAYVREVLQHNAAWKEVRSES